MHSGNDAKFGYFIRKDEIYVKAHFSSVGKLGRAIQEEKLCF